MGWISPEPLAWVNFQPGLAWAHESSFESEGARPGVTHKRRFVAHVTDQHQDCGFTQCFSGLPDRGQRRREHFRHRDIVKTNKRQVVGSLIRVRVRLG